MISVQDARDILIAACAPLGAETVSLWEAADRICAEDLTALRTQPPFDASAMDGYAVRFEDMKVGGKLSVIGEAPAGHPFEDEIREGQAVRIFTGGIFPDGADHVLIQEDSSRDGNTITVTDEQPKARNIRPAGLDFHFGDALYEVGTKLSAVHLGVLAAAGISEVAVYRRPKVAVFANGNELTEIGAPAKRSSVVSSTPPALCAWLKSWGADVDYLGIAPDDLEDLSKFVARAQDYDLIIPLGGASVGDYDFVKTAFTEADCKIRFSKIAVKPGKPTWFGELGDTKVLGLPGNPSSSLVCAQVFVKVIVECLTGQSPSAEIPLKVGRLSKTLPSNGPRALLARGVYEVSGDGTISVTPFPRQDSGLLTPFAKANALIFQAPNDQGGEAGALCQFMLLDS